MTGTPPNPSVDENIYELEEIEKVFRAANSAISPANSGEKLLCLDGGGIRGLIHIQVLRALERACGRPLHELFDWVAGTSTGGILALCIAHKRSLAHARSLYFSMKDEVFCGKRPYDTLPLEKVMKREFGEHTIMTDVTHPKVMVMGLLADRFPPDLHIFRNYQPPIQDCVGAHTSKFHAVTAPTEQLVWRAARASGAAPTFFRACGRFLDGGLISNNPTLDALTEIHLLKVATAARNENGDTPIRPLSTVVSLGTGRIPITPMSQIDVYRPNSPLEAIRFAQGIQSLGRILVEMSTVTEGRVVERARAWCHMANIGFHRFSPPISSDIALDCTETSTLLQMLWETEVYLYRKSVFMAELASSLTS